MSADSEHIDLLRRGPRPWNEWRAENPSIIPNLVGISLSIGDRQLGPINGGPINLARARLRHAFLRFATLTRANLEGADLSDALLERADLAGTNLAGANLCGANLVDVRNLTKAQLHEAEGDAFTVLPDYLDRPLIWTVAQGMEKPASIVRPEPRRIEEPREEEPPQHGERISWLVGGPRAVGRAPRADAPLGDPHNA